MFRQVRRLRINSARQATRVQWLTATPEGVSERNTLWECLNVTGAVTGCLWPSLGPHTLQITCIYAYTCHIYVIHALYFGQTIYALEQPNYGTHAPQASAQVSSNGHYPHCLMTCYPCRPSVLAGPGGPAE
jgi:hypothetical protein